MADPLIRSYVQNLATQNDGTAETVDQKLDDFETFCRKTLKITPSELVKRLKAGTFSDEPKEEQPYRMFQKYASWLKENRLDVKDKKRKNGARTVRQKMSWARNFIECQFIPVSPTLFKQLVKLPKPPEPDISPVDKKMVQTVVQKAEDIKSQTYYMFLGNVGWRPDEGASISLMDLENFDLKTLKFATLPAFVNVIGEHSKTKKGMRRRLTAEMARQFEAYLAYKYRPRVIKRYSGKKVITVNLTPTPQPEDLIFADYREEAGESEHSPKYLYGNFAKRFARHVERLGIGREKNGKRHKFTLHSFRRFVFTTCTRVVNEPYAKYHIGRKTHEYKKDTDEQIAEDFEAVEPYLTYLDTSGIELQQASILKQLEEERKARKNLEQDMEKHVQEAVLKAVTKYWTETVVPLKGKELMEHIARSPKRLGGPPGEEKPEG